MRPGPCIAPYFDECLQRLMHFLLKATCRRWRKRYFNGVAQNGGFDHMNTLEMLAHLQHYGGPTRLLDVTLNPLIALWFAVEERYDRTTGNVLEDVDGRLFAFCVAQRVDLAGAWGAKTVTWEGWGAANSWGTGRLHFWLPPAYNERISAQNAGFLVDGVPVTSGGGNVWATAPASADRWRIEEVREAMLVPARPASIDRNVAEHSYPTFNFRIAGEAKSKIRENLQLRYGYISLPLFILTLPAWQLRSHPSCPPELDQGNSLDWCLVREPPAR